LSIKMGRLSKVFGHTYNKIVGLAVALYFCIVQFKDHER